MTNTNIANKATQKGNYSVTQMTTKEIADMTPQNIKDAAALLILKSRSGVQVVSVKDLSILSQALCTLPEVNISEVSTIVRYVNLMPNGRLLISYYGVTPSEEIIDSLTKLAKTASMINGAIFSGYAALTPALGEEKHFSPDLAIKNGMTNIRVANQHEVIFAFGSAVKKMAVSDFAAGQWDKVTEVGTFAKSVLFLDRVQNDATNVVTEDKIVRSYSLLTKKAAAIQDQNSKLKVLSVIQRAKSDVFTTSLGLTQEPAFAKAV